MEQTENDVAAEICEDSLSGASRSIGTQESVRLRSDDSVPPFGPFSALYRRIGAMGFALVAFVAIGSLLLPKGPDQAMWTWVGNVILDHGVPYRDAWDIKGPLTEYINALIDAVFGDDEWGLRVADLLAVAGSAWILRRLVLLLNSQHRFGANCAIFLFCLMYYAGGYANTAQAEGWGGMLILWSVALLVSFRSRPTLVMAWSGVLVALATLIKPTFGIYIVLPLVHPARSTSPDGSRVLGRLASLASFSLVVGCGTLFLFVSGALHDYIDILRYIYTTYEPLGHPPLSQVLLGLPMSLAENGLLIPYLIAALGLWRLHLNASTDAARLLAVWLGLATLTVVIQRRYWQDHWLPASLAIATLLGVAISYITDWLLRANVGKRRKQAALLLVTVISLTPCMARSLWSNYTWPLYVLSLQTREDYITAATKPFDEIPERFNYLTLQRVASYVRAHSRPEDKLGIWGWDVSIFIMSHRASATRFGVYQGLDDEVGPLRAYYRQIFLQELESKLPRLFIVDTQGAYFLPKGTGETLLNDFPELHQFIQRRYRKIATLDVYQIWELVD